MLVEVKTPVEFCSLCPYGYVEGPTWNPQFQEEDYDVICKLLHKTVYDCLHWTECAAKTSKRSGLDKVPPYCPFNQKDK